MSCKYCFGPVERKRIGRAPSFCSNACKQAHYRLAKNGFVRQRRSKAAMNTLGMLSIRNAIGERSISQPLLNAGGTGVYRQVDWTA